MTSKNGVNATLSRGHVNQSRLAEQIRASWKETLEGIVQTGVWLIEGRFRKADYQRHALPFSYSWGRKLIKIARSPHILNPVNHPLLPDRADTLHQITLLSDRLFAQAITEGVINKQCLVIDIKQFRQSFAEPGQSRRRRLTVVYDCNPERDESALETLEAFTVAVQRLAQTRFPSITSRRPMKLKEIA